VMGSTRSIAAAPQGRGTGSDVLFLQLPSPPHLSVLRDVAGGYGVGMQSERTRFGHDQTTFPHLALVYAFSDALRAGVAATFLDAQVEDMDLPELTAFVRNLRPKVIVTSVALPSLTSDLEVISMLKREFDVPIAVAGLPPRTLTEEVLASGADIAVSGDIEAIGVELIDRILGGGSLHDQPGISRLSGDTIDTNPGGRLETLDDLPTPAFDYLPLPGYRNWEFGLAKRFLGRQYGPCANYFPVYLSRGCPFACHYCAYPIGHGKRHLIKNTEQVLDEVQQLVAKGVRNVSLRDQVLPVEQGAVERFCRGLQRRKLDIRWQCEARVNSVDADLLRLMGDTGCFRIHYGVETGDPAQFKAEAKRGIGPEAVRPCFANTRAAGIEPAAHLLIGFSHETWQSIQRTVEFVGELKVTAGDCSILTPYPGTPGWDEIVAEGRLMTDRWEDFTGCDPVTRLDNLSPVEVLLGRSMVLEALVANRRLGAARAVSVTRAALRQPARLEMNPAVFVRPFLADRLSTWSAFQKGERTAVGTPPTAREQEAESSSAALR